MIIIKYIFCKIRFLYLLLFPYNMFIYIWSDFIKQKEVGIFTIIPVFIRIWVTIIFFSGLIPIFIPFAIFIGNQVIWKSFTFLEVTLTLSLMCPITIGLFIHYARGPYINNAGSQLPFEEWLE